jgi:hypothetical protein
VIKADILGLIDDNIIFQVHNIEEMVCIVERHDGDDQYNNDEHAKYKKMIEDSKMPFYLGCVVQHMRLFVMVNLFQLKASNELCYGSFKDLLTLLKDIVPQCNTIPEVVYEAKQIICPLGLEVAKIHVCRNDFILYSGEEYEDLEKCPIFGLD